MLGWWLMAVASGLESCVYDIEEDSSEKALDRYVLPSGHWTTGLTFGVTKDEIFPRVWALIRGCPWPHGSLRIFDVINLDLPIFHDFPRFKSARPPIEQLLNMIPVLKPRSSGLSGAGLRPLMWW